MATMEVPKETDSGGAGPNKLRLNLTFDPEKVLSRTDFEISFNITNIGENIFLGGSITRLLFKYKNIQGNFTPEDFFIPSINPGKTFTSEPREFHAREEGIGWLEVEIKSNDDSAIELYIGDRKKSPWTSPFYIYKNEEMMSLKVLESIERKLTNIEAILERGRIYPTQEEGE